jgi:hypothetical protein
VASSVPISNPQTHLHAGMPVVPGIASWEQPRPKIEPSEKSSKAFTPEFRAECSSGRAYAEVLEFVSLPGEAQKLQREIPLAMRRANDTAEGLLNCIVLFSDQESRLVTVITLWAEKNAAEKSKQASEHLKDVLEPYVDRWLRTRSFVTFLSSLLPL